MRDYSNNKPSTTAVVPCDGDTPDSAPVVFGMPDLLADVAPRLSVQQTRFVTAHAAGLPG